MKMGIERALRVRILLHIQGLRVIDLAQQLH
jgi:hypothetical protein